MVTFRKKALAVTAAAAMAVTVAACGGGGNGSSNNNSSSSGGKGGTLTYYMFSSLEHLDPQRTYIGRDISNWSRTVYRQLVAFPYSTDPAVANKPVADLATDTGTASNGAKTWKFTLKDNVTWQDGKPVTCADVKYGASRVFATDVITGGPNYLLTYLDLPTDKKTGLPIYTGPYKSSAAGKAAFDKAITCDGNTVTYNFKKPWPDFPLAIAALHMMDPYRQDKDQGEKSNYQIFSNGPYMLKGAWNKESGGTLVRNPEYKAASDTTALRKALPDQIDFNVGKTPEVITSLLIADSGASKTAVTSNSIPPAYYSKITGSVASRAANVQSPFVDYLILNFKRMTNKDVRQALALATDDQGWIDAGGGSKAYSPADSIVNPAVTGYQTNPNPAFKRPSSGDPAAAKALLKKAGVKTPVKLSFTYPSSATADKQAGALKAGWAKAGFDVTLNGVANSTTYYTNIQKPSQKDDIIWAGWGSDWPSAITVTPPLFDSRPNLTAASNGQDYGAYKSDKFNKLVDQAQNATDLNVQTKALQDADAVLGEDVAYIPLEITKFYMMRGSGVTGYMNDPASNMYPDLGPIGVK